MNTSSCRKRPDPLPLSEAWREVRAADRVGRAARKSAAFSPSVDCSVSLFIDPRRSDQLVRGAASLPHGTGRRVRVAVFAEPGAEAEAARAAGAALVGADDLLASVASKKGIDADVVVATPDMLPRMGKVARILGPRCAL